MPFSWVIIVYYSSPLKATHRKQQIYTSTKMKITCFASYEPMKLMYIHFKCELKNQKQM